jgi:hypothetical protein
MEFYILLTYIHIKIVIIIKIMVIAQERNYLSYLQSKGTKGQLHQKEIVCMWQHNNQLPDGDRNSSAHKRDAKDTTYERVTQFPIHIVYYWYRSA